MCIVFVNKYDNCCSFIGIITKLKQGKKKKFRIPHVEFGTVWGEGYFERGK